MARKKLLAALAASLLFSAGVAAADQSQSKAEPEAQPQLWKLYDALKASKWIDLTHSFDSTIPHWKGFDPMKSRVLFDHDKDGFKVEEYCHVGQWGTHVDPPVHFHKGMRTAEDI